MSDIVTREMLATGDAIVTTLDDIQKVRDRAVAAAVAAKDAEIERLEYTLQLEKQSIETLTAAIKRLYDPDDCGDHCSNACPRCQATAALSGSTAALDAMIQEAQARAVEHAARLVRGDNCDSGSSAAFTGEFLDHIAADIRAGKVKP